MLGRTFGTFGKYLIVVLVVVAGLALSAAIIAAGWVYMMTADMVPLRRYALRLPVPINATVYALGILIMVVFTSRGTTTFIYFAF